MTLGAKAIIGFIIFFIGAVVVISINSFVGLFVGGSLQIAGEAANFSVEVQAGMDQTVTNLITNLNSVQTPINFTSTLIIVMLVLAVFGGMITLYNANKGKGDKGNQGSGVSF